MKFNPAEISIRDASHLLTDIVSPRPIAWVSSASGSGIYNLAPFSAYCMLNIRPITIGFSVTTYRDGRKKDTLVNIESSKEFVVCVVTDKLANAMNTTCAPFPPEISEFKEAGLTPVKADLVSAPLVAESPVNMECRLVRIDEFGTLPSKFSFIIGEVLRIHVADNMYNLDTKRLEGLDLVGRLGGDGDLYSRTRDTFQMTRPTLK